MTDCHIAPPCHLVHVIWHSEVCLGLSLSPGVYIISPGHNVRYGVKASQGSCAVHSAVPSRHCAQAVILRPFQAFMNSKFDGGIPDFMDGISDFMHNFNTF